MSWRGASSGARLARDAAKPWMSNERRTVAEVATNPSSLRMSSTRRILCLRYATERSTGSWCARGTCILRGRGAASPGRPGSGVARLHAPQGPPERLPGQCHSLLDKAWTSNHHVNCLPQVPALFAVPLAGLCTCGAVRLLQRCRCNSQHSPVACGAALCPFGTTAGLTGSHKPTTDRSSFGVRSRYTLAHLRKIIEREAPLASHDCWLPVF